MRLLIVGATGPTGQQLVNQAVGLGHEVSAVVRHEHAELPAGVRAVRADVTDAASLREAAAHQDAVICALGSKLSRQPTTLL